MKIFVNFFIILIFNSFSAFAEEWYSKNPDDLLNLKFSRSDLGSSSNLNVLSLKIFSADEKNDKMFASYGYNNLVPNRKAKIRWTQSNVRLLTKSYYVMVRYDPRFKNQVFIVDIDPVSNEQISRYENINSVSEATTFFKDEEKTKIKVPKKSIVSIKQISKELFFHNSGSFIEQNYLNQKGDENEIQTLSFTDTTIKDNQLIYLSSLKNSKNGVINEKLDKPSSLDIKEGVKILLNGRTKKNFGQDFLDVGYNDEDYLITFESESDGFLSFELNENPKGFFGKSLAAGRYFFLVEVGGDDYISQKNVADLYYAVDNDIKNPKSISCKQNQDTNGNIFCEQFIDPGVGNIYFMAKAKKEYSKINIGGSLNATIVVDNDKKSISTSIWDLINKKVISEYSKASIRIFSSISKEISPIAKSLLILYIVIYGIYFALGAAKITTTDLFYKVLKIVAVVVVIDQTKNWQFYNEYIFEFFKGGIVYIFSSIAGGDSFNKNPFTFIDVFLENFLSVHFWLNMLVLFIRGFFDGTIFVFILVFSAVWQFIKSMFTIVGEFFICYVIIYVLISIFPVLLLFVLFGLTKSMFETYMNFLGKYMIKPAIILLFFLIVSDLMNLHIKYLIKDIVISPLIYFGLYFDLDNIGIPNASIDIDKNPLLPYIPFFDIISPDNFYLIRHACAIYCISLCIAKLNDYAKTVIR